MRAIALAMGLNESTVSRTYKRWCESGDVVACGHTPAFPADDLYQLECLIVKHRSATADTLRTIAADPRHLGAEVGFFAVLHT